MRNTIAPVLISGGFRSNVIPGSAEATLNLRLIPGTDPRAMVTLIEKLVADPRVSVRLGNAQAVQSPAAPASTTSAPSRAAAVPVSSVETELYKALALEAKVQWPSAEVTPYLFQAGTDAAAWRSRGVPVYGIYPYPITNDELRRMHGNDERVSVESLRQGTDMIYRTLVRVAGKTPPR
jgi:acetylornithine deacetylase/succinyl-diaminopimelate desuccinylase-like protein